MKYIDQYLLSSVTVVFLINCYLNTCVAAKAFRHTVKSCSILYYLHRNLASSSFSNDRLLLEKKLTGNIGCVVEKQKVCVSCCFVSCLKMIDWETR